MMNEGKQLGGLQRKNSVRYVDESVRINGQEVVIIIHK